MGATDCGLSEVRRFLDASLPPGARAVIALSGGADSAGMAMLVARARPDLDLLAVHVRHGLRDDEADARAATAIAERLGLRCRTVHAQVVRGGEGPEAGARTARYEALLQVAAEVAATAVLVGHTLDDQAETALLNIFRGTGTAGLAGMGADRALSPGVRLLRPVLSLRRDVVRQAALELPTIEDPTNADPGQPRAWVRHHLLPEAARVLGRDPVPGLVRLAELARADDEALEGVAAQAVEALVRAWGPVRAVAVEALRDLPRAVASRVLRQVVGQLRDGIEGLGARAVSDLMELASVAASGRRGGALDLGGGLRATGAGGWLAIGPVVVEPLAERALSPTTPVPEISLAIVEGPAQAAPPPPGGREDRMVAVLAAGRELRLRSWRAGDRIRTRSGTRKLQDVFVDAGVPRLVRALVPVVVDEADAVCWVVGVAVSAPGPGEADAAVTLVATPVRCPDDGPGDGPGDGPNNGPGDCPNNVKQGSLA